MKKSEITPEFVSGITMDVCAVSFVIEKMAPVCSELSPVHDMLYRELGYIVERLDQIEQALRNPDDC